VRQACDALRVTRTRRDLFAKLDQAKTKEDFIAAAGWLKARPEVKGKIGAVGFCWGGGMVNLLATRLPDLGAGVLSMEAPRRSRTWRRSRRRS
jgi:dienelactone hydrolase